MEQRRAFASIELLLVICFFSVGLALSMPILTHKKLLSLPPLAGAVAYGYLTLPPLLAFLLERRTWLPPWLRDTAGTFLIFFGFPGVLALVLALWKLSALVTFSM